MSALTEWIDALTADAKRRGLSGESLKADVRRKFNEVVRRHSVLLVNPSLVEPDYPPIPRAVCEAIDQHMGALSRKFGGHQVDESVTMKAMLRAIAEAVAQETEKLNKMRVAVSDFVKAVGMGGDA